MALNSKVVQGVINCATVGNYVDLTSSGFGTPTAALVFISNVNTTNNPQATANLSIGFWTSSYQSASCAQDVSGLTTAQSSRKQSNGLIGIQLAATDTTLVDFTASAVTDGIRVTVNSTASVATRYVYAILFSGTTNVYAGSIYLGTGTSAIDVTAPGFKPDLVLFHSVGAGNTLINEHAIIGFGAAHNSSTNTVTQGYTGAWTYDALSTTATGRIASSAYAIGQIFNAALSWGASVSDFDANGFSITPNTSAGNDIIYYLALELPDPDDVYVGFINTPTSTGNNAYTGIGFEPQMLLLSQLWPGSLGTHTNGFRFGFGAADANNEYTLFARSAHATSGGNSYSFYDPDLVHVWDSQSNTTAVEGNLYSLDSDGFTINYTTVDGANSRPMLAIAIGGSSGGGTTSVSSDLADAYGIRAAVSSDLADAYGIRASVASSLSDLYGILSSVAASLADSYSINTPVSADLADAYNLRQAIAADLADAYSLRQAIAADLADAYGIRASVGSDLSDLYDILSAGSVSSDLTDAYNIRAAVGAGLSDLANIRAAVASSLTDTANIREAVAQQLQDAYTIITSVSADLQDSYSLRQEVVSNLVDAYLIASQSGTCPTAEDIAAAVLAAAQSAPIHANVKQMNDANVIGAGTSADKWRGA